MFSLENVHLCRVRSAQEQFADRFGVVFVQDNATYASL